MSEDQVISTASEAYQSRLRAYVKDKDPVALQRAAPDVLSELIEGVPQEKLQSAPAPGKWSVTAILAHLADVEIANSWRYRQILEQSGVSLPAFDQDKWAKLSDYANADPSEALQSFRLLRKANVSIFETLRPEQWQHFGMHVERGRLSLLDLVVQMAGHDLNHIEQVRRILASSQRE